MYASANFLGNSDKKETVLGLKQSVTCFKSASFKVYVPLTVFKVFRYNLTKCCISVHRLQLENHGVGYIHVYSTNFTGSVQF